MSQKIDYDNIKYAKRAVAPISKGYEKACKEEAEWLKERVAQRPKDFVAKGVKVFTAEERAQFAAKMGWNAK